MPEGLRPIRKTEAIKPLSIQQSEVTIKLIASEGDPREHILLWKLLVLTSQYIYRGTPAERNIAPVTSRCAYIIPRNFIVRE